MNFELLIIAGEYEGERFPLYRPITIGKNPTKCDLVFSDTRIARVHCRIYSADGYVYVKDFGAYPRRLGFSGKLSYNSLIGPIELGVGKDQYLKDINVFFGFGYYIKDR